MSASIPFPLPSQYRTTTEDSDEPFLVYDNGSEDDRMLVFASNTGLQLLGSADTWFCDGTHSSCPPQFAQLFCVRVPLGDTHETVVYGLLSSKQQTAYEELFTATLDACLLRSVRPNPVVVVCDFEVAIHNAVRSSLSAGTRIQVQYF